MILTKKLKNVSSGKKCFCALLKLIRLMLLSNKSNYRLLKVLTTSSVIINSNKKWLATYKNKIKSKKKIYL